MERAFYPEKAYDNRMIVRSLLAQSLLTLGLAALAGTSLAQKSPGRVFLDQRYAELRQLTLKKDGPGLGQWIRKWAAADFRYYTFDKRELTRDELIQSVGTQFNMMQKVEAVGYKIIRFTEKPGTMSATVETLLRAAIPNNKKTSKLANDAVSIDQWVKVGNDWKLKRITTTRDKTTIDGKEFGF
jgi:hypothetical protein